MSILITLLIVAIVAYLAFWIIGQVGLPHPVDLIAKGIVGLILLVALLSRTGFGGF